MGENITVEELKKLGCHFFEFDENGRTLSVPVNKFINKNPDLEFGRTEEDILAVLFMPKSNQIHAVFRICTKDDKSFIYKIYHNQVEI